VLFSYGNAATGACRREGWEIAVAYMRDGIAGFVLARCCCSACCKAISVATLNRQRTRGLFDRRAASNVSMVATGIPKMTITITHTIDRINCDTMKRARAWLGSHGAACNFHDHRTAGIARHVRFRLADASA
jgi:hypothetical protein